MTSRCAAVVLASLLGLSSAQAQETAADALALVKRYIELHNSHDLESVMALYAENAVFYLSMGRPAVHGRDAIESLERFDVAAQSTLYPQEIRAERDGDFWRVHLGGVIEHSEIFEAAGVSIVMAQGIESGFVLRDGKIVELRQPDLEPACTEIVAAALRETAAWLVSVGDPRRTTLVANGFLRLTPTTIPAVVQALRDWRGATKTAPAPVAMSACARFDPLPG